MLPEGAAWEPTLVDGSRTGGLGLAEKAAPDLGIGIGIGDTVSVEHPQATPTGLKTVRSDLPVVGTHPNPMRMFAYLDPSFAEELGLAGTTNTLSVTPANGVRAEDVRRALMGVPHVASAQTPQAATEGMRATLDEFVGLLNVAALVTLRPPMQQKSQILRRIASWCVTHRKPALLSEPRSDTRRTEGEPVPIAAVTAGVVLLASVGVR